MELRHLRYFVAVAEEQNVTRAAARLHVSQPPLSRQIRALEDELGVALFDHGPKALRLTDAGRVFLVEAQAVLRRADEAVQAAKAVANGLAGEIHVGFAPSLTVEILPGALRRFHELSPAARVHLHDLSTQEMLRGLRDQSLDLALMIQSSTKAMNGLVFEKLREYPVCLAMHPSHPLSRSRQVNLQKIALERLITYRLADYPEYHEWLADLFNRADCQPNIAEEHESSTSLIASVEAGRGVALVQKGFECLAGPRLKIRPLSPPPPPFIVGIAHRSADTSATTKAFIRAAKLYGRSEREILQAPAARSPVRIAPLKHHTARLKTNSRQNPKPA